MKHFGSYLRGRKKELLYFLLCGVLAVMICFLYRIPLEAGGYGFVLCGLLGLFFVIPDYRAYGRHLMTVQWLGSQPEELKEHLPQPRDELEQAYQQLALSYQQSRLAERAEAAGRHSDMLEYYTMWAHQIKTPIAALDLLLQSEEELSRPQVEEQLFRIWEYVEMVMTYLRVEDMSSDLVLCRQDLDRIVRAAVKKYSRTFIHRRLRLIYEPLSRKVLTDEKWLQFVIEQLLSNALKYTRKGTVSIYMDSDHPCRLVIEDSGIGIRQEDLPRVFERGFTGQNGRVDKKATGLGLYLCRQIMTRLSHEIGIESEEGKGTRVWLDLETMDTWWE